MLKHILSSAILQVFVVTVIALAVHALLRLIKKNGKTFLSFVGFQPISLGSIRFFAISLLGFALLGVLTVVFQFYYDPDFLVLLDSENSPYGKILREDMGLWSVVLAFLYAFLQASLSEEILFRGVVAKQSIRFLGLKKGLILQAVLFWLPHFFMLYFVMHKIFSISQVLALVLSVGTAIYMAWYNERQASGSIWPSWIFHGTMNFVCYLTILYFIRP